MSIQNKRRESMYFRDVSHTVSEKLTNSNISLTTVTDVKLSKDGSVLNVYVTFDKNKEKSFEAIKNTSGYVRSEIAKLSNQRIVPRIVFKYDKTADSADKIEKILKQIKEKNNGN